MGQAPGCCTAASKGCFRKSDGVDDSRIVPLHSLEFGEFAGEYTQGGPLAEINEALYEALAHFRRGDLVKAAERLVCAEVMLEEVEASPAAEQLRRSFFTDPELQELKIRTPKRVRPCCERSHSGPLVKGGSPFFPSAKACDGGGSGLNACDGGHAAGPSEDEFVAIVDANIANLLHLCNACRVSDAKSTLDQVEGMIRGRKGASVEARRKRLGVEPMIVKLRTLHRRVHNAVCLTSSMEVGSHKPVVIHDDEVGKGFRFEFVLRPAVGDERDDKGPYTQLMAVCRTYNFPLSLRQSIAVDVETDLFQKEWIHGCKLREALRGPVEAMHGGLTASQIALSPLPISLEEVLVREVAVFETPPLNELRPGVLVVENTPPIDHGQWENWTVPSPSGRRGVYRVVGASKAYYKMASVEEPGCSDLVSVCKIGISVPTWLLPLETLKGIVASKIKASCKVLKAELIDKFDTLKYNQRMSEHSALYEAVGQVAAAQNA